MAKFGLPGGRRTRQPQQATRTDPKYRIVHTVNSGALGSGWTLSNGVLAPRQKGIAFVSTDNTAYARHPDDTFRTRFTDKLSAIVLITPLVTSASDFLFGNYDATQAAGDYNWGIYWTGTGNLHAFIKNAAGTAVNTAAIALPTGAPIVVGMSYDGATIKCYMGNTIASIAQTGNIQQSDLHLAFGGWNAAGTYTAQTYLGAVANTVWTDDQFRGLLQNPWQIFQPRKRELYVKASGGVSGTIAVTMDAFTSSITGTTTIVGSMAQTAADAVSAITGTTTIVGSMAQTLGNDVGDLQGTTTIVGSMAATAQNDTASMAGTTTIVGSMGASTENATSTITATTTILGTIAQTMADFIAVMAGTVGDPIISRLRAMIGVGQ